MIEYPLALNILEEELVEGAALCAAEKLGMEVTAFAFPKNLDRDYDKQLERHTRVLGQVTWTTLHGPFLDLYPASPDPKVVDVSRRRHGKALHTAAALGARIYVAHLSSIPLIRNTSYRDRFARATADFWKPFADQAARHSITIVLENLWETGPEWQKEVVETCDHPNLKASFDNGHALIFSDRSATEWIEVLGADLAHCHLHDNDGTYDLHDPIGEGTENWPALIDALETYSSKATVVLETDYLEKNKKSLQAFRTLISAGA